MDNRPIGVFDSGLGGLTAFEVIRRKLPNEDIIYFADTGRMPYGDRSKDQLILMCRQDIEFLRGLGVKSILAACGTVSTTALPVLEPDPELPITGVIEPGSRIASETTRNGRIGVIATAATIKAGAFPRAIQHFSPKSEVMAVACPKFVQLIESGHFAKDDKLVAAAVDEYLRQFRLAETDTLLLGCTHYRLMQDAISDYLGDSVAIIDAGETAAEAFISGIRENGTEARADKRGAHVFYTSGSSDSFRQTSKMILGRELDGDVRPVPVMPV